MSIVSWIELLHRIYSPDLLIWSCVNRALAFPVCHLWIRLLFQQQLHQVSMTWKSSQAQDMTEFSASSLMLSRFLFPCRWDIFPQGICILLYTKLLNLTFGGSNVKSCLSFSCRDLHWEACTYTVQILPEMSMLIAWVFCIVLRQRTIH